MSHAAPSGITADQALELLTAGNQRFLSGRPLHPNADIQRAKQVAQAGQQPFATIVGCSDSRVPVELIFDAGIGDVFIIRVAGNVCANDEIGSVEYGVGHLGSPLCVVLGHTKCGAVTAVLTGADVHGCIPKLVAPILPAADKVKAEHPGTPPEQLVSLAVRENVWQAIADLLAGSVEIRKLVLIGKVRVVGALYDLETCTVEWLGAHPREAVLLAG